jgi:hypothetical protein
MNCISKEHGRDVSMMLRNCTNRGGARQPMMYVFYLNNGQSEEQKNIIYFYKGSFETGFLEYFRI